MNLEEIMEWLESAQEEDALREIEEAQGYAF